MDIYAYAKKRTVFTTEFVADLARKNREARIKRYPETANYGDLQAEIGKKMSILSVNPPKISLFNARNFVK
jgi:hypothetical protein